MEGELPVTSSRNLALGFFVFLVVNVLVIWLASSIFPQNIVLGTAAFTYWWAVFHSMAPFSLVGILAIPLFEYWQETKGEMLSKWDWMSGYLVVNFVALWVMSRFSEQFGLGFSAWWVVLILAAVFDLVQGFVWNLFFWRQGGDVTIVEVEEADLD